MKNIFFLFKVEGLILGDVIYDQEREPKPTNQMKFLFLNVGFFCTFGIRESNALGVRGAV